MNLVNEAKMQTLMQIFGEVPEMKEALTAFENLAYQLDPKSTEYSQLAERLVPSSDFVGFDGDVLRSVITEKYEENLQMMQKVAQQFKSGLIHLSEADELPYDFNVLNTDVVLEWCSGNPNSDELDDLYDALMTHPHTFNDSFGTDLIIRTDKGINIQMGSGFEYNVVGIVVEDNTGVHVRCDDGENCVIQFFKPITYKGL